MMEKIRLGDLVEFQRGYDLPKNEFKNGKIPVISSNGILGYHNEVKIKEIGITIGRSGTVGFPHLIKQDFFPHNTTLFIKNFNGNNVVYIYYLLKSLNLNEYKSGSGVPTINRNHLHPLKVTATKNKETQQKIAKILSDIDDKIEILHQINDNLAELAKTIYDYWFVQFDFPDENGKPYKTSGGKMVYNDILKREIPEGWEVKRLGEILKKNETTIKINAKDYLSSGSIPIIDQSSDFICGYTNEISALIKASNIPAIIFGDHTRILKFIDFDFARGADGTQILFSNNEKMPQYLFYHSLLKIDLSNYGYARHFKFLKEQKILLSDRLIAEKFTDNVKTIYEKIKINRNQIQHLQSLRDWLLPMLMNGQVSVE